MLRNIEDMPVPVAYWLAADGRNPHAHYRRGMNNALLVTGLHFGLAEKGKCPFQLGTGWRQTGAAPTLLPLGVDNTVVEFTGSSPKGRISCSLLFICSDFGLLCDHQTLLSPISHPSADVLILHGIRNQFSQLIL